MNYRIYAFAIIIVLLFTHCKYDIEIQDSPRLLQKANDFGTFQFDVNTPFSNPYKWSHFKLKNSTLL